ncbi:MAG: hypoxanthine phosphoribosyltransferase [Candidatus Eremiobacteraeota bacterium]|nr:hypoxanthine phosphoribosyltransferase [Candidatus Eremiobacteraeota bacterium]MBV8459861.1 hypoxanthine phosphoribosyltransferase [Candidatus Eremiobacteraeota bacterium]MBV8669402.1 hypoxanthine phosphoribosyltransferase [Candidatus Eremiobacteraeota bacterium]
MRAHAVPSLGKMVFSEEDIARAVARLGAEIRDRNNGLPLLMIGVLKGALPFAADLMRALGDYPLTIDFMVVSSYGAGRSGDVNVRLLKDLEQNPAGHHLLLVEDIVDEGHTLAYLLNNLRSRQAASIQSCALIDKPFHRVVDVKPDYVGLRAPEDAFLVGYGLDFQENFRNLPHIRQLRDHIPT